MTSHTPWQQTNIPSYPKLTAGARYDVIVVGGGITGLTAAYLIKKAGKSVCVLERTSLGMGDTGCTTAHLTYVTDTRLPQLMRIFGRDEARLVWAGGKSAINTIERIVTTEAIGCEFQRVPGFFHASFKGERDESRELKDEAELAHGLGFHASYIPAVPFLERPGVRFSDQAKFHPRAYLAGLARAVDGDGSEIHENSEVAEVQEEDLAVKVNGHVVHCGHLLIATHVPLMGKTGLVKATLFQTKLAPYSSYAIGARFPVGLLPTACYWDTSDPYYYLRVDQRRDTDYVIFGGEDHKTGQEVNTAERVARLEATLLKILPMAQIDCHWSGQVIETHDGLPYVGETAERQYVATGFSGNGMTFGTLGAMILADRILGRENPWSEIFDVHRKKLQGGAWDYIKENLDYPYYLIKDRLSPPEGNSTRAVKRGEGKILVVNGERVACSRDSQGKVTMLSPVCTHMGCLVRWNSAEKTWDCPCHGSRFQTTGEVLAGPAETPLEVLKKPEPEKKRLPPKSKNGRVNVSSPHDQVAN